MKIYITLNNWPKTALFFNNYEAAKLLYVVYYPKHLTGKEIYAET